MAIDTAEKRKSVAGVPSFWGLGVTPNASKDQEWRQQAGWGYSGIATDEPSETFNKICWGTIAIAVPDMTSVSLSQPSMASVAISLPDMTSVSLEEC